MAKDPSRRTFVKSSLLGGTALAFPFLRASRVGAEPSPLNRLNIACIGVGGRGKTAVRSVAGENLVAFADVDDERASESYANHPGVPRYRDYRRLLDRHAGEIDAITISTPDHMHFPIALAALELGKHVFVEKPLTHTIAEARRLAELAKAKKVATQMGNQGHANEGPRLLKEWYDAGVLGQVREVHSWTDRPIWPQGVGAPDHSKAIPVVPAALDWDLWLGVAASRPYDPAYAPFNWRGYWDFGTGALGDMGCHIMDGAYWALGLDLPAKVTAIAGRFTTESAPTASVVVYEFPAREGRPALKWTWYDGGLKPPQPEGWEHGRTLPGNGTLVIGERATVLAPVYYDSLRIVPERRMQEIAPTLPPKTIPRIVGGHFAEWLAACKGGAPAGSNFEYAARLTEVCLLSNVAVRAGRPIRWDASGMRVVNDAEASRFVTRTYRPGFGV